MRKSIILCGALEDEAFARFLATFLDANFAWAVSCTDALVGADISLLEASELALSADVALVLLSPASVPKVWPRREEWERVFVHKAREFGTKVGFVLVNACTFPSGLRKQHFFDASKDRLTAAREIKRWLLGPDDRINPHPLLVNEGLESLRCAVADQPGTATGVAAESALQFAAACSEEFEDVYRFDCRAVSRAGIVGDIGCALGLRMSGKLEQNCSTLQSWCTTHRALFVLAGVKDEDRLFITPGGLASLIFAAAPVGTFVGGIESATRDAVRNFYAIADPERRIEQGWAGVRLLKAQERFLEALELLEAMADLARAGSDDQALQKIDREKYWITQDLGGDAEPPTVRHGAATEVQLTLPFSGAG